MIRSFDLDLGWINSIRINRSAVEARVKDLPARRTWKKRWQVKAYLHAISCIDLTTLRGDDTYGRVDRLCAKALQPVTPELLNAVLQKHGLPDVDLRVGAVCVYPEMVEEAFRVLKDRVPVASVATGFPAGKTFWDLKWQEVKECVRAGAREIDIVINRTFALNGDWRELYHQIKTICDSCRRWSEGYQREIRVKTILEVSDLQDLNIVAKASAVAMMGGSDFIKTSTGYGDHGATLEAGLVMVRQIREFYRRTGQRVAFKPAGSIASAKDGMAWLLLMKEEAGDEWTYPEMFRIGASRLLNDIERQLDHLATGAYSAGHRHPIG